MKVEKVWNLVNNKMGLIQDFGFFEAEAKSLDSKNILKIQKGIIRTNCIDNLDRTNVVQSIFGRVFLNQCLKTLGISEDLQSSSFKNQSLESAYRNLWTNNAN